MIQYIIRRVLGFIPVLFGVALFTFILVRAIPGGPFDKEKPLPPAVRANLEAKYHLDWPVTKQFISYLAGDWIIAKYTGDEKLLENYDKGIGSKGLILGDFGYSTSSRIEKVSDIIRTRLPTSFQLGMLSLIFALVVGIPLGTVAALKQNTWIDYVTTFLAVFFLSVPNLVLGPLLIWILAVHLGWLPTAQWGSTPPFSFGVFPGPQDWNMDFVKHAIMPVFALGTASSAGIARLTRASVLQVIREDYIRTARAKGLSERVVIGLHALKNAMIPVVTILGPAFAGLVTGTFVVEQIFGINGLGKHFVASIGNRDYQLVMGVTLLYSALLVFSNLMVDIAYGWLDPRIRFD